MTAREQVQAICPSKVENYDGWWLIISVSGDWRDDWQLGTENTEEEAWEDALQSINYFDKSLRAMERR